jgi:uncharacterized membrane protein
MSEIITILAIIATIIFIVLAFYNVHKLRKESDLCSKTDCKCKCTDCADYKKSR